MNTVLGVDACKGGWVGVALSGETVTAHYGPTIDELVKPIKGLSVIAIDIPIGLPERTRREADVAARKLLGPRSSSVFMTPVRAAVEQTTHALASSVNRDHASEGMSVQAFGLFPKIREVDKWHASAPCPVYEVHPELSFLALAGEPLAESKKTWAGAERRRRLLADAGIDLPADLGEAGVRAGVDDVLDAAAAAWTARRIHLGEAIPVPAPPQDLSGVEAAIWR